MSVTNAETFKITGGSVTANYAAIIKELAEADITATHSNGVLTITNATLASTSSPTSLKRWSALIRIVKSANATVKYVVAS